MLIKTSEMVDEDRYKRETRDGHTPYFNSLVDKAQDAKSEIIAKVKHRQGIGSGHIPQKATRRFRYDPKKKKVVEVT